MISIDLARELRDAGLHWEPANGDRFFIPDRDLDDEVFAIAEMTVDMRTVDGGREIAFNGAVEWALDAIQHSEVVWLPSEMQLRDLLAERFVTLRATSDGFACEARIDGTEQVFVATVASDAYGSAVLAALTGRRFGTD